LGNYFNQELSGDPTSVPWGLEIFARVNPSTGLLDNLNGVAISHDPIAVVVPTFLYEMIWDLLIAVIVVWADRRLRLGHGRAFALYVASYAFGRFWIEQLRSDTATHVFGVRINVWVMALLFIAAMTYFVLARRRGPREDPETFPGHQDDDRGDDNVTTSSDEDGSGDDKATAGSASGTASPDAEQSPR